VAVLNEIAIDDLAAVTGAEGFRKTGFATGKKGFFTNTYTGYGLTEFAATADAIYNCINDGAFFCKGSRRE
jgi:hypothetical protein